MRDDRLVVYEALNPRKHDKCTIKVSYTARQSQKEEVFYTLRGGVVPWKLKGFFNAKSL